MKQRLQYVAKAHGLFDRKLKELQQRPDWKPTTCCKGCHACCSEPLHVNRAEAKVIAGSIPQNEVEGVKARTREWVDKAKASGLLNEKLPSAFAWLRHKIVCPLLKDGLCLVYGVRPFGCRSHCAVGDPALCHSIEGRKEQKYFYSPELDTMVGMVLLAASRTTDHLGVFLAEELLDEHVASASRQHYDIEFSHVSGPDNKLVFHLKGTK